MDRATFFKHFDLLADQPDAVAKMRGLVLELAVRGKLVPQNPKDEPVSKLLERICEEIKNQPEENAKNKKATLPPVVSDEFAFAVPPEWAWVRTQHVTTYVQRGKSPKYSSEKKIPVIAQKCIQWHGFELHKAQFIDPDSFKSYGEERLVRDGDLLWNSTGLGTLGRIIVFKDHYKGDYPKIVADSHVTVIRPSKFVVPDYLFLWFSGPKVQNEINAKASGSTKQTELATSTVLNYALPLPPLAEQRRIVAKVDELMALCDELAARQQSQQDAGVQFQRSALHHLTTARDQNAFAACWQRVCVHFNQLHDSPDAITQLRQAILQLGVQGHLGTQDRKDEPASKLVERARTQWPERKVSERQNWKPEEPPCDLPAGWVWTCLDALGNTNPRNEADDDTEVAFTPMKFIAAEYGRPAAFEVRPWSEIKKGFTHFANNDVVLAKITPCFENGKSAVMRGLKNGIGAGTTELHVFRGYDGCVLPDYVLLFLKTSHFIETGVPRMTGSAGQKRVPWDYFANSPFPLPPLAKQKRIVARVDELMHQCDVLEAQLTESSTLGTHLLDSTIHHLFTGNQAGTELAVSSGRSSK